MLVRNPSTYGVDWCGNGMRMSLATVSKLGCSSMDLVLNPWISGRSMGRYMRLMDVCGGIRP